MLFAKIIALNRVCTFQKLLGRAEIADVSVRGPQGMSNRGLDQRLLLELTFEFLRCGVKKRTDRDFPALGHVRIHRGQKVLAKEIAHRLRGLRLSLRLIAGRHGFGAGPSRFNRKGR